MATAPEVKINIIATGAAAIQREFKAIASGAARMRGQLKTALGSDAFKDFRREAAAAGADITSALSQDLGRIRSLATVGIGAGLAAGGGSVLAFTKLLRELRQATEEAAREINRLEGRGKGLGLNGFGGITDSRAETMGALEYSVKSIAGLEDGDNVKDMISTLIETIIEADRGDKEAIEKLKNLGINDYRLFYVPGTDKMREIPEILEKITDASKKLTQQQRQAGAVGLWGDEDGIAMASVLATSSEELRKYMSEYARYVGMRESDTQLSKDTVNALHKEEAAWLGTKVALQRGYGEAVKDVSTTRADFLVGIRPQIEAIAKVFGDFRIVAEAEIQGFALDVLRLFGTTADDIDNGPLRDALDGLLEYIAAARARATEFVSYLATGKSDVPWVNTVVQVFSDLSAVVKFAWEAIKGLYTYLRSVVTSDGMKSFLGFIDDLTDAFGADEIGEKAALILGLFLFRNVLFTIATSTIPFFIRSISGLVKNFGGVSKAAKEAAEASEGALKKAAEAGTDAIKKAGDAAEEMAKKRQTILGMSMATAGIGAVGVVALREGFKAADSAELLRNVGQFGKEAGDAYGAAAYLGIRQAMMQSGESFRLGGFLSDLMPGNSVADVDAMMLDGLKEATEKEIREGAAVGLAMAGRELTEPLEVAAGIKVTQADIDAAVLRILGVQETRLKITEITNMDEIRDELRAYFAEDTWLKKDSLQTWRKSVEIETTRGALNATSGTPVNLYIGGREVVTLNGQPDAVATLQREAAYRGMLTK